MSKNLLKTLMTIGFRIISVKLLFILTSGCALICDKNIRTYVMSTKPINIIFTKKFYKKYKNNTCEKMAVVL